jgi:hypothetical protein
MEHFAPLPDEAMTARLPEPVRVRVMEELEGDAAALLGHFRARGMSEEAAAREVEAWIGAGPAVWRELEEIHRPIAVRWADRLLEPQRHGVERAVLLVAGMSLLFAAMPLRAGLIIHAPFGAGWVVLAMSCAILALALGAAMRRWRAPSVRVPRHGILALLGLGAPAVGLLGAALTLSQVSDGGLEMWSAIQMASGVATVGLMAGIAGGALWSVEKASDRIRSRGSEGGV